MQPKSHSVLVCLGPTGSGKTSLASQLAPEKYEIISCDSRQLYRGLEAGSAAPPLRLRRRIRHHLVSILEPCHQVTAGLYRQLAEQAIYAALSRKRIPLLMGGSGFYYRALQSGMFPIEKRPEITRAVQTLTPGERLALLREKDPQALLAPGETLKAGKIHPNDSYRVARALEICLATAKPWSQFWQESQKNSQIASQEESQRSSQENRQNGQDPKEQALHFHGFYLELQDMERYRQSLRERALEMVKEGIIEEAQATYQRYGNCPGLSSVGFQQALQANSSKEARNSLAEKLAQAHWQYSRKQRSWLRREKGLKPVLPANFLSSLQELENELQKVN